VEGTEIHFTRPGTPNGPRRSVSGPLPRSSPIFARAPRWHGSPISCPTAREQRDVVPELCRTQAVTTARPPPRIRTRAGGHVGEPVGVEQPVAPETGHHRRSSASGAGPGAPRCRPGRAAGRRVPASASRSRRSPVPSGGSVPAYPEVATASPGPAPAGRSGPAAPNRGGPGPTCSTGRGRAAAPRRRGPQVVPDQDAGVPPCGTRGSSTAASSRAPSRAVPTRAAAVPPPLATCPACGDPRRCVPRRPAGPDRR
jgi:hypothetical protein